MPPERERYRPSGRFDPVRMAVWFVLFSPFALLGGYLVCVLMRSVGAFPVVWPLVGGLLASLTAGFAVRLGRCRSRAVGVLTGVLAGLTAYLAAYQLDFAYNFGARYAYRVDALPDYLELRLRTDFDPAAPAAWVRADAPDAADDAGRAARAAEQALGPIPPLAWARLAGDAAAACVAPVLFAVMGAAGPFAEELRRWLYGQTVFLDAADAYDFANALKAGDLDDMADALRPIKQRVMADSAMLTVYYLPYDIRSPVFLFLSILKGAGSVSTLPTRLLKYDRLTDAEVEVLKERLKLPGLTAGDPPVVGRRVAARVGSDAVIDLPGGGTVLTRANLWRRALLAHTPLLAGLAAAAGAGLGGWLAFPALGWAGVAGAAALGLTALVVALVFQVRWEHGIANGYTYRRVVAAVRERPDPVATPDDPEAVLVEVIPRQNWGRVMLENASDLGFLKLDRARRLILFEGDRQRWRLPAAAVTGLAVEEFYIGVMDPKESNVHAVLVLTAVVGGEPWEAPLCRPHVALTRWTTAVRRRDVAELEAMLREFIAAGG